MMVRVLGYIKILVIEFRGCVPFGQQISREVTCFLNLLIIVALKRIQCFGSETILHGAKALLKKNTLVFQ